MAIWFTSKIKNFNIQNKRKLKLWIEEIIKSYNKTTSQINIVFVTDTYLSKINKYYLNHSDLTDIISFDYSEADKISGDVFISIERVKENANFYNESFNNELKRVIIHGILHFLGFRDESKFEKIRMRQEEEKSISIVKELIITTYR